MLDISMSLMRMLISTDFESTGSCEVNVVVDPRSTFVDMISGSSIVYNGVTYPNRLMYWVDSDVRRAGMLKLFRGEATLFFCGDSTSGICFAIKRHDKPRSYYSRGYRTLNEAADDAFVVCEALGTKDIQEINRKILEAREAFEKELKEKQVGSR